jgi:Spy/CpxP family protein refolding chaperone
MECRTMARMNKSKGVIAMAGLLGGLALAGASAFAQTSAPAAPANQGGAMMDHEMPNGQGGMMSGMMMNGETQRKKTRMMDNCNRMMESGMQNKNGAPANKGC